jgi:hypothetical protein
MWLDHGSIQESFDFHFSSPDAMRFIPVKLGETHTAVLHTDPGNAFELSPSAGAKLTPEPHDIVDIAAHGNHLDLADLSDNFKVPRTRVPKGGPDLGCRLDSTPGVGAIQLSSPPV